MPAPAPTDRPHWQRALWLIGGGLSLLAGLVGVVLPLLPTVPFVLLAAFCFSRGSERCEQWILDHRHFGPMVRNWRANRVVPLRAKWLATGMMTVSSVAAWFVITSVWRWAPAVCCTAVALWMWQLPHAAPSAVAAQGD